MLIGFASVATVPFHMWARRLRRLAVADHGLHGGHEKAAAFAAFIRVWLEAFPFSFDSWHPALRARDRTMVIRQRHPAYAA